MDVSVQMLFGLVAVLFTLLLVFETSAYWHARNVYDEAAAEGVRVAAAFDGDCARGITAATQMVRTHGGSWAKGLSVGCTTGPLVQMVVSGRTPGVIGGALGFRVRVVETAPKEG